MLECQYQCNKSAGNSFINCISHVKQMIASENEEKWYILYSFRKENYEIDVCFKRFKKRIIKLMKWNVCYFTNLPKDWIIQSAFLDVT